MDASVTSSRMTAPRTSTDRDTFEVFTVVFGYAGPFLRLFNHVQGLSFRFFFIASPDGCTRDNLTHP